MQPRRAGSGTGPSGRAGHGRPGRIGTARDLCAAVIFFAVCALPSAAGSDTRRPPLVKQVEGNCYERRVWEKDGTVSARQRIFVHNWTESPEGAHARIDVVGLKMPDNGDGPLQVEEQFDFRIVGDMVGDAQEEAALQIIGHLGGKKRIALNFLGNSAIYPDDMCRDGRLPPVEFNVEVKGGLVDLLGGRAEIRIVSRNCDVLDAADDRQDGYLIQSELRMKTYLIGIRFMKRRYSSFQLLDPDRGLIRYVLQDEEGRRQEIALADRSACTPPWVPIGS